MRLTSECGPEPIRAGRISGRFSAGRSTAEALNTARVATIILERRIFWDPPLSPADRLPKPPGERISCDGWPPIAVARQKVETRQHLLQIIAQLIAGRFADHLQVQCLAVCIDAMSELDHLSSLVMRRFAGIMRPIGDVVIWHFDQLRRHEIGPTFDFIEILMGINPEMRLSFCDDKHRRASANQADVRLWL